MTTFAINPDEAKKRNLFKDLSTEQVEYIKHLIRNSNNLEKEVKKISIDFNLSRMSIYKKMLEMMEEDNAVGNRSCRQ